jgi:hypothetical protein
MEDSSLTPGQKVAKKIINAFHDALLREGITEKYLARKLKLELSAEEIKVFNPKGNQKKKGLIYSKPLKLWSIRQKAREDAQKLMDLYPAEKHEHEVSVTVEVVSFSEKNEAADTGKL